MSTVIRSRYIGLRVTRYSPLTTKCDARSTRTGFTVVLARIKAPLPRHSRSQCYECPPDPVPRWSEQPQ